MRSSLFVAIAALSLLIPGASEAKGKRSKSSRGSITITKSKVVDDEPAPEKPAEPKPAEPVKTEAPAEAPKAAEKAPETKPAEAPKAAEKAPETKPAEAPKAAEKAPETKPAEAPKAAEKAPETKPAAPAPVKVEEPAKPAEVKLGEPVKPTDAPAPLVVTPVIGQPPAGAPVAAAKPAEYKSEVAKFRYALHGFLRAGYAYVERDAGSFTVGQNSGFRLANARLALQGGYGERVKFDLSYDAASLVDPNTNHGPLSLGLRDANVSFSLGKGWVTVGQFKTPFNGEFLVPDGTIALPSLSVVSDGIRGDEGRIAHGALSLDRQLGAEIGLRLPVGEAAFEARLAAVNGNGINVSRNDNALPALLGRLSFGWRGNTLSASGLWNDRTQGRLGSLTDERDLAFEVDAFGDVFGVHYFGMYALQKTTFLTATDQTPRTSYGAVGALSYPFELRGTKLEPAYRIALYSPTDLIPEAALLDQSFGLNYYPPELPVRVQAAYTVRLERIARSAPNNVAELFVQANF